MDDDDEEDIGMADLKDSSSSSSNLNFEDETAKEEVQSENLI